MRVAINMCLDGTFTVYTDEPCEVFVICEHAPNDRVYRLSEAHEVGRELVDEQLGTSEIGHAGDDRHAAIANRIISEAQCKPHLKPVN